MTEETPARPRPLLIYDGDCGFCRSWIARWRSLTGETVDYLPYQEAAAEFPAIPVEDFKRSVHLIEPGGQGSSFAVPQISTGAKAVFRALRDVPGRGWMDWAYGRVPGFAPATEAGYRWVAGHRSSLEWITKHAWGNRLERSTYHLSRWLFLRLLGIIYFIAFGSIWLQWRGLIGSRGILPAADFVGAVERYLGSERFWRLPTLCWFGASDSVLNGLCIAGMALAACAAFGLATRISLMALWAIYLSLVNVGQDFLSFQWDALLLETGLLAIFYAPGTWGPGDLGTGCNPRVCRRQTIPPVPRSPGLPVSLIAEPAPAFRWLLWWLLARLMFLSGATKLTYGDPTWHDLSALTHHYETQPLPTWIGWYAHQLPPWFQAFSVAIMYVIEVFLPLFIFLPRRCKQLAAAGTIFLMLLIGATGNYTFFNLLCIALCITLLDDAALARFFPQWMVQKFPNPAPPPHRPVWRKLLAAPLVTIILAASTLEAWDEVWGRRTLAAWMSDGLSYLRPFRSINGYGLFRVMTTSRPEIIIEGSNDGATWQAYEFKWKPGDLMGRPAYVEPHQPRLDWQMWFAALSAPRRPAWFNRFILRLFEGQGDVPALLSHNPFPDRPPRYIRAVLYDYHFTNMAERARTGAWWRREVVGEYLPVVSKPRGGRE